MFKFETDLLLTERKETTNQMTEGKTDFFSPLRHGHTKSIHLRQLTSCQITNSQYSVNLTIFWSNKNKTHK